jgi:hypothetical protein
MHGATGMYGAEAPGNRRLSSGARRPMFNPHYSLWSALESLSISQRLFCLILCVVSIYTIFSATVIMVRLWSLAHKRQNEGITSRQHALAVLYARCVNMQQLIGASFYLFGFIYFMTLPFAFNTLGDSKGPGWVLIFENLGFNFAFAADVFFVFFVLHSVQWFVSARVSASARHLNVQHIP